MGMGDRNYSQWEKETEKMSEIDHLIDKIRNHEGNIVTWQNQIDTILSSDNEDKVQDATKNSTIQELVRKIELEEDVIGMLKIKFEDLSKKLQ